MIPEINASFFIGLTFSIKRTLIIVQTVNTAAVNKPYTKMPVYQGADCIAYNCGYFLKCRYSYMLYPINTPMELPIAILSICFHFSGTSFPPPKTICFIHCHIRYSKVPPYYVSAFLQNKPSENAICSSKRCAFSGG